MRFKGIPLYLTVVSAIILCLDLITKFWVNASLPMMGKAFPYYPYGGIAIFHNLFGIEFSINHMTNRGAAWGVLDNFQGILLIARIILISGMLIYLFFFNRHSSWRFPLVLVITGAIGNIIDYFIYGHVVDMFHFVLWGYDFPVFNVADSAVTIGICWLFALSLIQEWRCRSAA
jgi:signal peptidase II